MPTTGSTRLHPEALARVMARLQADQSDFACFGMTFVHQAGDHVLSTTAMNASADQVLGAPSEVRANFFALFARNYWSSVWNKVFRADFVREHALQFDSRLAVLEDFEFVVRALAQQPTVTIMRESLYAYSKGSGSLFRFQAAEYRLPAELRCA